MSSLGGVQAARIFEFILCKSMRLQIAHWAVILAWIV